MKQRIKLLLVGLMVVPTLNLATTATSATTNCDQQMNQAQNIGCGNVNAPVAITVTGGGNVNIGSPVCYVSANQSASQLAACSSSATKH